MIKIGILFFFFFFFFFLAGDKRLSGRTNGGDFYTIQHVEQFGKN